MRTIGSLLDGERLTDAPRGVRVISDPSDLDRRVSEARLGDAGTFVAATRSAANAQRTWAATPAPVRGQAIQHLGELVSANKEALAGLIAREIGKPIAEARGEVQEVIDTCAFFQSEGRR